MTWNFRPTVEFLDDRTVPDITPVDPLGLTTDPNLVTPPTDPTQTAVAAVTAGLTTGTGAIANPPLYIDPDGLSGPPPGTVTPVPVVPPVGGLQDPLVTPVVPPPGP
jgi:hypothetical protein